MDTGHRNLVADLRMFFGAQIVNIHVYDKVALTVLQISVDLSRYGLRVSVKIHGEFVSSLGL